jgi:hypothetical protein
MPKDAQSGSGGVAHGSQEARAGVGVGFTGSFTKPASAWPVQVVFNRPMAAPSRQQGGDTGWMFKQPSSAFAG